MFEKILSILMFDRDKKARSKSNKHNLNWMKKLETWKLSNTPTINKQNLRLGMIFSAFKDRQNVDAKTKEEEEEK